MTITTTPGVDGKKVSQYLGIVTGEAIMGADFVKDFLSGITDIVGGRSAEYEQELRTAKEIAMKEMQEMAEELGADAIVGVDIDYETLRGGNMLMVSTGGTAVKFE